MQFYFSNNTQDISKDLINVAEEQQETCRLLDEQMQVNGVTYIVENGTRCLCFNSRFLSLVVKVNVV